MWASQPSSVTQGGGFMDESMNDGQSADKSNIRRGQNVMPVMVSQLTSMTEELEIWGIATSTVTFMGTIKYIESSQTKVTYTITDETGTITVIKWLTAEKDGLEAAPVDIIEDDTFVRVYGLLRDKNVLVLHIAPLQHLDELTCHLLEVTKVDLLAEKWAKQGTQLDISTHGNTAPAASDGQFYGMTPDQTLVYNIVQAENGTESGVSRTEIKARLPPRLLEETDELLDFLVSEGHVYTTCTDDHFKTT